jgi:hypothetical protein
LVAAVVEIPSELMERFERLRAQLAPAGPFPLLFGG